MEQPEMGARHKAWAVPMWIADRNPFYLVSGVLMLGGCFMVNHAAHDDPDVIWPVVGLVALFNLYEFMVIGLSVYLSRSRTLCRDAGFLLFLEVLLLCDIAHSYNELALKSPWFGWPIGALAFSLAGLKLWLISRGLGIRITRRGAAMLMGLIALLFIIPGLFRELTRVELVREWHFYLAWWLIGVLPLLVVLTRPWFGRRSSRRPGLARLRRWIIKLLFIVPIVSLLLHMRTAHYVDDRVIHFCNFAPLVLGLSAAWMVRYGMNASPGRLVGVLTFAGALAVGLSVSFPDSIAGVPLPMAGLVLSPLRVVLFISAVLLTYAWWWRGAWLCLPVAAVWLSAAWLGHSVSAMTQRLRVLFQWTREVVTMLIPDTMMGWGMLSVAASFVFLLLGATASLLALSRVREKALH